MRILICDVCGDNINTAEGKSYLAQSIADLVAEQYNCIYDICLGCTLTLHSEIRKVIEDWKTQKGNIKTE